MSSTTLVERYLMGKVLNIISVGHKCAILLHGHQCAGPVNISQILLILFW